MGTTSVSEEAMFHPPVEYGVETNVYSLTYLPDILAPRTLTRTCPSTASITLPPTTLTAHVPNQHRRPHPGSPDV